MTDKQKIILSARAYAGIRLLLFKFRSGTHGLNEELGRHRGREGKIECNACGAKCDSVVFMCCGSVLFIVPNVREELQELLGDRYRYKDLISLLT